MRSRFAVMAMAMLVSACGGGHSPDAGNDPAATGNAGETAPAAPLPTDDWIGNWTGVEGLALRIARGDAPGHYRLTLTLLDSRNVYQGEADGATIRFRRGDRMETIRHVPGSETGLKWLADKPNCLVINPGEGFCRPD